MYNIEELDSEIQHIKAALYDIDEQRSKLQGILAAKEPARLTLMPPLPKEPPMKKQPLRRLPPKKPRWMRRQSPLPAIKVTLHSQRRKITTIAKGCPRAAFFVPGGKVCPVAAITTIWIR